MKITSRIESWPISLIELDPYLELSPINPEKENAIYERIMKLGFLDFFPLLVWERPDDVLVLLKGRTKLSSAKRAGWTEVPIIKLKLAGGYQEARDIINSANGDRWQIDHAVILHYLLHVRFHGWGGDRRSEVFKLSADDLKPKMEIEEPTTIERIAKDLRVSPSTIHRVIALYYKPLSEERRQMIREGKLSPYKLVAENKHHEENPEKSAQASEKKGEESLRSKPQKSYERLLQNLGFKDAEIPAVCRKAKQEKLSVRDYVAGLIKADLAQDKAKDPTPNHNGSDDHQQVVPPDGEQANSKSDSKPTIIESDVANDPAGKDAGSEAIGTVAKPHPKHETENASAGNGSAPRKVATSSGYVPKGRPETKDNNAWQDCQSRLLWVMHLKKNPETLHKVLASQYQKLELELLGTPEHARAHSAKAAECKYEKMRITPPPCVQDLESMSDDERTKAWAEAADEIRLLPDR